MTVMAGLATLACSIGLYPLFERASWFWAGLGAVLAVSGGSLLARRLRIPAPIGLLVGLAALMLYLNLAFAGEFLDHLVAVHRPLGQQGEKRRPDVAAPGAPPA
ncbi:hypothetical protein AB0K37_39920, partial [Actinomadura sp. NPDC049753]